MSQSDSPDRPVDEVAATTGIPATDITGDATLDVENIGGITECSVTLTPGITILTGENATNRTSLLTALNGALGGTEPTVHGTAETGEVTLELETSDGPSTFTRTFHSSGTGSRDMVRSEGDGVCDDPDLVDTFATLLEHNDARQAVQNGGDLRDVLMRPVDTDQIEADIRVKQRERAELRDELDEIEREIGRETTLTEQREQLRGEIDGIEAEIEELRERVEQYEADEDMAEEAETLVNDLEAKREEKRSLQNDIEVLESEREGLLEEESELEQQRVDLYEEYLSGTTDGDATDDTNDIDWDDVDETISDLESRITDLQARKDELNSLIDDLTQIIQINRKAAANAGDLPGIASDADGDDNVTAALDPSSQNISCWTCGSSVEQSAIEDRTSELQDLVSEKRSEVSEIEDELSGVRDRARALRDSRRSRENIADRLSQIETEKIAVSDQIQEKEQAIDGVESDIEQLEREVEETAELRESDLLDAYQELNELQYKLGRKESELDDITESLSDIEAYREEREDVEADVEAVTSELEELRTVVADRERDVVDAFNGHMETLLDRLAYGNIARVWIERKVSDSQRGEFETGEFDLHIVRESSDGVAYEDTVDTLSESEREVVGLVVALAGYLVHDVADVVPFILLDSVEAVDANRLVDLVTYFAEHTAFVTVALLPEDAAPFPDDLHRVTADVLAP